LTKKQMNEIRNYIAFWGAVISAGVAYGNGEPKVSLFFASMAGLLLAIDFFHIWTKE